MQETLERRGGFRIVRPHAITDMLGTDTRASQQHPSYCSRNSIEETLVGPLLWEHALYRFAFQLKMRRLNLRISPHRIAKPAELLDSDAREMQAVCASSPHDLRILCA
jgi:hypothetical protein